MPTARNARTAAKLSEEINEVTSEQDTAVAGFRKKKRLLNEEYNHAVAKEEVDRKLSQMSEIEKDEFLIALKAGK